jgi:uncharacterized protein (DUF2235 family)
VTISAKESPSVAQRVSSQTTNVLQFYRSVLPNIHNGRVQQKWYDSGSEVLWFHRFRDGSFGYGVDQTILKGYAYLAATYEPGDDLFIYGFSRGTYSARSLVGLLTTAGLPSTSLLNIKQLKHIREATINLSLAVVQPSHLAQCL